VPGKQIANNMTNKTRHLIANQTRHGGNHTNKTLGDEEEELEDDEDEETTAKTNETDENATESNESESENRSWFDKLLHPLSA